MYTSGRHFIGPDFTFKVFQANAHFVKLDKIAVWTGDKIEIKITCTFQYFLRKDFLADLHEAYNVDYKPVVRGTAIDAIKGRAADLPIDDYIRYASLQIMHQVSISPGHASGMHLSRSCIRYASQHLVGKKFKSKPSFNPFNLREPNAFKCKLPYSTFSLCYFMFIRGQ